LLSRLGRTALHEGGWNSRERTFVYGSSSIAQACLEMVVHLAGGGKALVHGGE
jgi:hypothetical protein